MQTHAAAAPLRTLPPAYPRARAAAAAHDRPRQAGKLAVLNALRPLFRQLGVNEGAANLLAILVDYTQNADWLAPAGTPILVWASNADLAHYQDCSLPTIKRRLRQLRAAGLITDRNSANGVRHGARRATGEIDVSQSFGLDLSPLAADYDRLAMLARQKAADRQRRRAAHRAALGAARDIADIIGLAERALPDEHARALAAAAAAGLEAAPPLAEDTASLTRRADALARLRDALDVQYDALYTHVNHEMMSPEGVISDPLIQNTSQEPILSGNGAPSKMDGRGQAAPERFARSEGDALKMPLALIESACPALYRLHRSAYASWPAFFAATDATRAYLGISAAALDEARAQMGQQLAAVALAIILERADNGDIRSTGGYLRALTDRHGRGELRLRRSLFALLRRDNAPLH